MAKSSRYRQVTFIVLSLCFIELFFGMLYQKCQAGFSTACLKNVGNLKKTAQKLSLSHNQKATFFRLSQKCFISKKEQEKINRLSKQYHEQIKNVDHSQRDKFTRSWLLNVCAKHNNSFAELKKKEVFFDRLILLGLGIGTVLLMAFIPSSIMLTIYVYCIITGNTHDMRRIERFAKTGKFDEVGGGKSGNDLG